MAVAAAASRDGPSLGPAASAVGDGGRLRRDAALAVFLFALALRLPTLGLHQLAEGDGVHYASLARSILAGDLSGMANPYWSNLWPAVIAATSRTTGLEVVTAGRVAALLAGCCLAVLAAALAARGFGATTGLVAGLLVAGHPWLIHFSTLLFTESLFALLLVAVLYTALRAPGSRAALVATGVLGGLAVTTRPEGYAVVAVATAYVAWRAVRRGWRRAMARAGLLLALVALFLGARALAVHRYFGEWDLGGTKGTANLLVGLADSDAERERLVTEIAPEGETRLSRALEQTTLLRFAWAHPGRVLAHARQNIVRLAGCTCRVFPQLPLVGGRSDPWQGDWPPVLLGLALAAGVLAFWGGVRGCLGGRSRPLTCMLLATLGLYLLGLTPLFVHDRLVVALVPAFLVLLAAGLTSVWSLLGTRLAAAAPQGLGALVVIQGLVSLLLLVRAPARDYAGDPVVHRLAAEWLATRYPQTTRIMTASPSLGFYFYDVDHEDNGLDIPWAELAPLVALARRQRVDLLVVPAWHLLAVGHPAAAELTDPARPHPGLRHVVTLGDEASGRMLVFEVSPEGPGDGGPAGARR
ncbi:MAG TPA: glycosyltransferase family 39 protein [Vicinamibacteria bacterium]|nr:glycosyltransferase family 39 protein [Vicinamibacteria bacterium]